MSTPDLTHSIRVKLEGPNIGRGWVPVPDLVAILDGLQNAMVVVMEDLWGRAHRRGPVPSDIQQQASLRLGDVQVGSFTATLTLERPPKAQSEMFDVQPRAIDRLLAGVEAQIGGRSSDLPDEARRQIDTVASRISRTEDRLILEGGTSRRQIVISAEATAIPEVKVARLSKRVRISGRLLEIDYRDGTAEVWDPLGRMTRIRFDADHRDAVDAARLHHVTVEVTADVTPSGRPAAVRMESLLPIPVSDQFWHSQSLAEVASEQPVRTMEDPTSLVAAFWEEDDEEEFLAALQAWRQET
ncbi:MAG: hypothetical protein GEU28_01965 [Dehalococcoidia bacterium]|nr:hypothetical protein [Dehalococcoidia bacterium]